jgi:hypothetical protein
MKIQCDACQKQEASLFCPADEAALCNHCDHTIHQANKLSAKHKRFSLHHPTSKDIPLCDICKVHIPSPFHCYFSTGFSFYIEKTGCNIKVFDVYVTATLTAIEAVSASFDKRFSATIIS